MKKIILACLTLLILSYSCIFKTLENSKATKWKMVWNDEFDYAGLPDFTKWNYDTGGWGWGNQELQ